MRVIFDVVGIILLLASMGSCALSKSSMGEIAGIALLVAAAVFLVGAALLREVELIRQRLTVRPPQQ